MLACFNLLIEVFDMLKEPFLCPICKEALMTPEELQHHRISTHKGIQYMARA